MTSDAVFDDLRRAAAALGGARLFTVTVLDRKANVSRRAYTSHPDDYPVTGTKPHVEDGWSRQVMDEGRTFVANTTAEFAAYFPDHAQINALGCRSAVNLPVADDRGQVIGTVNILDAEGHFTPARVAALERLVAERRPALAAAMARVPMG